MNLKIGIVCASDDELAPFLPEIDHCGTREKAMLKFYEGKICGIEVVAVYSGVCKVNAAIAAQILIDDFGVSAIMNAGVAGGMDPTLRICDTVISTEVCYHDVEHDVLTEFHTWMDSIFFRADDKLLELSRTAVGEITTAGKVYWGRMVTGESFIENDGRESINQSLSPLSVDMESASIAHVCYVNGIPFLSIRCITDTAEHSGHTNFEENCTKASEIAKDVTVAILSKIRSSQNGVEQICTVI